MMLQVSCARWLLPILIAVYWGVGFYPFDWFFPHFPHENAVSEMPADGLSFTRRGIAYTETAPAWVSVAMRENAFQVNLKLRSHDVYQGGPARIITLSRDDDYRNFTVGQEGTGLVIRLRTTRSGAGFKESSEFMVPDVFHEATTHRVVVRVTPSDIQIEVDGHQALVAALPPNALSSWDPRYRLALGNEFTFHRPWRGAIYNAKVRVLDTEFDYGYGDLRSPETYSRDARHVYRELAESMSLDVFKHASLRDSTINLIGFAPLGLLLAFVTRKPLPMVVACLCCAALSLSIETGQLFLDKRMTSVADLLLNASGGCIGAWSGARLRRTIGCNQPRRNVPDCNYSSIV